MRRSIIPIPTMTAAELAAWDSMAADGTLSKYAASAGKAWNQPRTQPEYEAELARRVARYAP